MVFPRGSVGTIENYMVHLLPRGNDRNKNLFMVPQVPPWERWKLIELFFPGLCLSFYCHNASLAVLLLLSECVVMFFIRILFEWM